MYTLASRPQVMTCIGGCIGGGGQPKSKDPQALTKRMQVGRGARSGRGRAGAAGTLSFSPPASHTPINNVYMSSIAATFQLSLLLMYRNSFNTDTVG